MRGILLPVITAWLFVLLPASKWNLTSAANSSVDSLCYFPLAVGNSWTYGFILDTSHTSEATVIDTTRINGRLYYLYRGSPLGYIGIIPLTTDTIRVDTLGRLCRFENSNEYMIFEYSVDSGGTYFSHTTYPQVTPVSVKRNVESIIPAGHFTNCIDLYFSRSFTDESVGYDFAPDVGIVRWYGPFIGVYVLLRAVVNGRVISSVDEPRLERPTVFSLEQNYPNPFNPVTNIRYHISDIRYLTLKVYDIFGREVATLVNEVKQPGTYTVRWDASGIASGAYLYRLQAGEFTHTRGMFLVK